MSLSVRGKEAGGGGAIVGGQIYLDERGTELCVGWLPVTRGRPVVAEGAGIADRDGKLVEGVEEGRREEEGEETKSRREREGEKRRRSFGG